MHWCRDNRICQEPNPSFEDDPQRVNAQPASGPAFYDKSLIPNSLGLRHTCLSMTLGGGVNAELGTAAVDRNRQ